MTSPQLGQILNKLSGLKGKGDNWSAKCPAHDDKQNSLSIKEDKTEILIHCFAGCPTESIVNAIGLNLGDLFIKPIDTTTKPKIVSEYSYRNELGEELYQVVRYDPKAFKQRHREQGKWVWNMNGQRRIPYHLDGLQDVTYETVYLTEGEKDADTLWYHGYIGTTTVGGAGAWNDDYAQYFKGMNVVIIPDKDSPGLGYAYKAARALEDTANTLSVIILDNAKDITEWIEKGGDPDLLPTMEQNITAITKLYIPQNTVQTVQLDNSLNTPFETVQTENTVHETVHSRGSIIWHLIDEWLLLHMGERFDIDTICKDLDLHGRVDRQHVSKKLTYEIGHERVEKFSDTRPVTYIYINNVFTCIDWVNAPDISHINLKWPYGIEDGSRFGFDSYADISPGDIIVVAGLSNMGKTAFCLNLLWENMNNYPCTLMGNEYTPAKFKERASSLGLEKAINSKGQSKFELIERHDDWKTIIRPNNINIIDWLNLEDSFYKMGSIIEGIKSKLKEGIAVICIQKDASKPLGLGGGFSEHMASLYLALDFERLTVRKCKAYSLHNPNGEMYAFKLSDRGTKFSEIHKVRRCRRCYGTGKVRNDDCQSCNGTGYVPEVN